MRLMRGNLLKHLHLKRFPRISLHCKLVPVQYWEYEYGLLVQGECSHEPPSSSFPRLPKRFAGIKNDSFCLPSYVTRQRCKYGRGCIHAHGKEELSEWEQEYQRKEREKRIKEPQDEKEILTSEILKGSAEDVSQYFFSQFCWNEVLACKFFTFLMEGYLQ